MVEMRAVDGILLQTIIFKAVQKKKIKSVLKNCFRYRDSRDFTVDNSCYKLYILIFMRTNVNIDARIMKNLKS